MQYSYELWARGGQVMNNMRTWHRFHLVFIIYSRSKLVAGYSHSDPISMGIFVKFPCIEGLLMDPSRLTDFDLLEPSI